MKTQILTQIIIFVIYVVVLIIFSKRWQQTTGPVTSYSLNGDLTMLAKDNVTFDRRLTRESCKRNLKTDVEKCEWALEKMKDMFQFFNVADVSLWPYQLVGSFLGAILVCYVSGANDSSCANDSSGANDSNINLRRVLSVTFLLFVLIDLPRRFLGFHKNALLSNKALNIHTFYYKYMKGKNLCEDDIYN